MIECYRIWFEHERDSNQKMLEMIDSVPDGRRGDPKFSRAVDLAAHLAACRENWLDRMQASGDKQVNWWAENVALETLRPRFTAIEKRWTDYLADLTDDDIKLDFEFPATDGYRYRWNVEGQIVQLVGHAFYHRGQIAQLVNELGGETVDTDYLFWAYQRNPRWGRIEPVPGTVA